MRLRFVPWPVLAALLLLLLATPVLAAGGSPGSGNYAGGEGALRTGCQSSAMSVSSHNDVETVSGPATSGSQGGGIPDRGSPANSATDFSSSSVSGSPATLSNEGSSQPPDLTGSGDGAHEGVFVEKSDQNPGGNPSLSSSAEAHGGHSMNQIPGWNTATGSGRSGR